MSRVTWEGREGPGVVMGYNSRQDYSTEFVTSGVCVCEAIV